MESIDISRYSYRINWSDEDNEFVATCVEFPLLSWLAPSQSEALQGFGDMLHDVITDMQEQGEQVPEPFADRNYSGKFNLRIGRGLHRKLAVHAAENGMSLNQYVLQRLTVE
jgi:predicted HicB family RNase H-like nuclease